MFNPFRNLRNLILSTALGIAALVFLGVTLAASLLYEDLLAEQFRDASRAFSRQTFDSMYQVMSKGWSRAELERFIASRKEGLEKTPYKIDIYRGKHVEALFGTIEQREQDDFIRQIFITARERNEEKEDVIRYGRPLMAEEKCLKCHVNANVGEILGVIELRQDMNPVTTAVRQRYVLLFLLFGGLVLLLATALSFVVARKTRRSLHAFHEKVAEIHALKDLHTLDENGMTSGFEELDQAYDNVRQLARKLKAIAVDKDILEFEIRLLGKFIITSEVVRDWREVIKELLLEINTIIDAYVLFTLFDMGDGTYEWEIFWRNTPSDEVKALLEEIGQGQFRREAQFCDLIITDIQHHVCNPDSTLPALGRKELELQTKALLLDAPKIGGIVGIGMQSQLVADPIRHVIIDSVLSTLLNLAGSVKAIHKYTEELEYYATRDPLTRLHNQRVFWDMLEYEVARAGRHGQEFAVMVLDLDNFKTINDRYGHHFGDQFLQTFARILQETMRLEDFVSRYGGDEFTVLLPQTSEQQASLAAMRLLERLERHGLEAPDGTSVRAGISIGIACYPKHNKEAHDLFLIADNMMYKAKKAGKNTVALPNEAEIAEAFKQASAKGLLVAEALEKRQIIPYFQPIIDTATGCITIHELLMRIEQDGKIIPAGEFIEVAENMGVVHKMDLLLMELAFIQMARQRYEETLFINLSPKSLIVGEFIARARQLAEKYGIDRDRIVFEITERETIPNLGMLEKFVADLKLEGFRFAIDDFGSGFSSFQYLKHFPIDYLKIEGDFIRNMLQDEKDMAFIKSMVALGQGLGIKIVAEFVESADILAAVSQLNIHYAQGYHVGRPSPQFATAVTSE